MKYEDVIKYWIPQKKPKRLPSIFLIKCNQTPV